MAESQLWSITPGIAMRRPTTVVTRAVLLPRAKTDTLPSKDAKANVITVDVNNQVYLNNTPITLDALKADLDAKVAADPDVPVFVRGDERLEYGAVMDVVKVVYGCHVRKMALVTKEK